MTVRTAAAVIFFALVPSLLFGQRNIVDFYRYADSLTQTPPLIGELKILGQKKLSDRYVTFIGYPQDKSVFIAAVTLQPIKKLNEELSLAVRFKKMIPDLGKISTWGYVFDRNHDGKIDYMALVGGAAPYKDSEFPADYPRRGEPLLNAQMEYYISHCRIAFDHWADDNYDGKLDAVIHIDMDPERDYVDRQIVARSTKFNGVFDDVWAFRGSDGVLPDSVPHTAAGVAYHPIQKPPDFITQAMLDDKSGIMKLLNTALKQLKLTAKNLARFSEPE